MTPRAADQRDDVSGACQLRECGYCHGNIDLKAGPGPAVPLHRCACPCHHGHIRQARQT
jgi:hypothetical protein